MNTLPTTSGKTPAGNGGIGRTDARDRPAPKPVVSKPAKGKTPAPKATTKPSRNAPPAVASPGDPYGVMSSLQPALQALSGQQQAQLAQQNQQRQAIQDATNQFLKYVQGQPSVVNDYTQAAQTEGGLANNAAQYLQQANPSDAINAIVSKLNPDQASQIASHLGNVFTGGAGVLDTTQGLIPGSLLAEQGAHAAAFQKSQLPNVALQGIQGLKQFGYNANVANQALAAKKADLLAQIPGLTQKAQATAANLAAKTAYDNARLGQSQQRINAGIAETNARLAQSQSQFTSREAQQQNQFIARYRAQTAQFNARQKSAQAKLALPNASLSKGRGYLVDSTGAPIRDAKGQLQVLPGFKMTSDGQLIKVSTSASTKANPNFPNLSKSQVMTLRATANELRFGTTYQGKNPLTFVGKTYKTGEKIPPTPYPQALDFLISHGYSRGDAIRMLNRFYPKSMRMTVKQANANARQGKDQTGLGIQVVPGP